MENNTKKVTIQDYIDYIKGKKTYDQVIQHAKKSDNTFVVLSD